MIRLLGFLVVLVCAAPAALAAAEAYGPPKGARWEPLPALTDEFEGRALDGAKWHPCNPQWKGRQPGFFSPRNVTVSDGKLHITMRAEDLKDLPEGYHTYTCGAVKSKVPVRYGYFEIKCRPMNSKGSSAFWFYDSTPETWTEIDVFEMGAGAPGHQHTVHMNAHVFHTLTNPGRHWSRGGKWQAPWTLAGGYHVYALQWDRDTIRYYVDGAVVRETANTHWHQPLYLNFDSETMPKWFGLPEPETLPSTFSIEYVRAWKKVGGAADEKQKPRWCEFRFPGKRPEAKEGKRTLYELPTDAPGRLRVLADLGPSDRPRGVTLAYHDEAFFDSQEAERIAKTVKVKDRAGREVLLTFHWSRHKDEKASGGYRADSVEVRPAVRPPDASEVSCIFASEGGCQVRLTFRY